MSGLRLLFLQRLLQQCTLHWLLLLYAVSLEMYL